MTRTAYADPDDDGREPSAGEIRRRVARISWDVQRHPAPDGGGPADWTAPDVAHHDESVRRSTLGRGWREQMSADPPEADGEPEEPGYELDGRKLAARIPRGDIPWTTETPATNDPDNEPDPRRLAARIRRPM